MGKLVYGVTLNKRFTTYGGRRPVSGVAAGPRSRGVASAAKHEVSELSDPF